MTSPFIRDMRVIFMWWEITARVPRRHVDLTNGGRR